MRKAKSIVDLISNQKIKKNVELGRYFIDIYFRAREGLKYMDILRSELSLQSDYAEWLVSNILKLELCVSGVQKDYDAVDKNGKKYQIKSRKPNRHIEKPFTECNTSFDFKRLEGGFDYFVGVFFKFDLEVEAIMLVPYNVVAEFAMINKNRISFRWNKKLQEDERIKYIFGEPKAYIQ